MLNLVVSVILGYIPGCFQRIHTLLHTAFKSFFRCLSAAASVTLLQPSTLQRRPSPWRRQNFPEESRAALVQPPYRQGVDADLGLLPSPPSAGKKKKKKSNKNIRYRYCVSCYYSSGINSTLWLYTRYLVYDNDSTCTRHVKSHIRVIGSTPHPA